MVDPVLYVYEFDDALSELTISPDIGTKALNSPANPFNFGVYSFNAQAQPIDEPAGAAGLTGLLIFSAAAIRKLQKSKARGARQPLFQKQENDLAPD